MTLCRNGCDDVRPDHASASADTAHAYMLLQLASQRQTCTTEHPLTVWAVLRLIYFLSANGILMRWHSNLRLTSQQFVLTHFSLTWFLAGYITATVRLCRIKETCLKTDLKCVNRWSSSTVHQTERKTLTTSAPERQLQCKSKKSSPPLKLCAIFSLRLSLFPCQYVASLYLRILTNFSWFVSIFNKMALIFLRVPIVFNVFSFKFHRVKSLWLHRQ